MPYSVPCSSGRTCQFGCDHKTAETELDGRKYTNILEKPDQWEFWAAPKDKAGKLDHNKALTGDDLNGVPGAPPARRLGAVPHRKASRCEFL